MKTAILDTEPIYEAVPAKELAVAAVASFRVRRAVERATVRESDCFRRWLPEVVLAFMVAAVIKPSAGQLQQQLYGK